MNVHLTTLGCPKNQVDSELMLGMLSGAGFPIAERAEDAECVIVNTCAFIDRAREESVQTILDLAQLKETGTCRALIVTGCLTQRYGGDIMKEMPEVDGILGTSDLHRIVDLVRQAAGRQDWATAAPPGYLYDATTPRLLTGRVPYAYVKIAEGCDMGCTFCAIPQFRGRHRSRPLGDIVREVQGLAARGVQEAILVSQDTLAYGKDLPGNGDIGDLLLALGDTRMPWVRPMYLHPAHVNDRLLDKWSRAHVVPYLDLPVQHGDERVEVAEGDGALERGEQKRLLAEAALEELRQELRHPSEGPRLLDRRRLRDEDQLEPGEQHQTPDQLVPGLRRRPPRRRPVLRHRHRLRHRSPPVDRRSHRRRRRTQQGTPPRHVRHRRPVDGRRPHRPRPQDPFHLDAQVPMQPSRGMLVDDEEPPLRIGDMTHRLRRRIR